MAETTGPILLVGGITLANKSLLNGEPFDWRIAIATGLSAGAFALLERLWQKGAVGLAWLAVVTVLLVRLDPKKPAPVENLNKWFEKGS
jgi:type IV secretory pathway TrbD component